MKISRIYRAAACAAALAVTGCNGGGGNTFTSSPTVALPPQMILAREKAHEAPKKIYISNAGSNTVTTFKYDGTPTTPTITDSLNRPNGVAVDANGKIYVANSSGNSVTTYNRFGKRVKPTIYVRDPYALTVDSIGKIYVSSYFYREGYRLYTYNPNGSQTAPTIEPPQNGAIGGVAVDASGKIYLSSVYQTCLHRHNCYSGPYQHHIVVSTYNPDGSPTTPAIEAGQGEFDYTAGGVAVDANGKIYVLNPGKDKLKTYNPDGSPARPVIKDLSTPMALAIDGKGKIYITNVGNGTLTTYKPGGSPTTPTIGGLASPGGVAVH